MRNLINQFKQGDIGSLSRLISLIENESPYTNEIMDAIYPMTGKAHIIGVTGPPGAGKSTLVDKMIEVYRQNGFTVGVLAIDPSSIYTGGAFLGDRVRMDRAYRDDGIYLRSMATRGELGGLAPKISEIIKLLDAFGKDVVIVETVGVGQMEVDIINYADTKVVVSVPGLGDQMQAIKAGIIEIADVFVVNKADTEGALNVVDDLKIMLMLKNKKKWVPEIVLTEALNNKGVTNLFEAIQKHKAYLKESGLGALRIQADLEHTCLSVASKQLKNILLESVEKEGIIRELMEDVKNGRINPYRAAGEMVKALLKN